MIELMHKKIDHAYETNNMIVHVSEDNAPVLLEIFNARKFFMKQSKILPNEMKEQIFATV